MRDSNVASATKESAQVDFSHSLHGSRSLRGSQGKPPLKPSPRCSRCSAASILICEDQSLSTTTPPSPARPAQDDARHDHLVLRRLCLMAKRRRRKRQWTLTPMAAAPPGYRPAIRPGNPGDRPHDQPHAPQMPRLQDAVPSLACRTRKGCSNLLLLTSLRFAPESRGPFHKPCLSAQNSLM